MRKGYPGRLRSEFEARLGVRVKRSKERKGKEKCGLGTESEAGTGKHNPRCPQEHGERLWGKGWLPSPNGGSRNESGPKEERMLRRVDAAALCG